MFPRSLHRLLAVVLLASASCTCVGTESASAPESKATDAGGQMGDAVDMTLQAMLEHCVLPAEAPIRPPSLVETDAQTQTGGVAVAAYTAHPDDESMYGGGTFVRLVRAGHRVAVIVASHGEGGRLLLPDDSGALVERRDLPRTEVVRVRDAELREAMAQAGTELHWLYPATANLDDAFTRECTQALARWDRDVPGGLRGIVERLVEDLRERRPRIVVTLDPRDDPHGSSHGHHEAIGLLVDLSARLAADARFGERPAHRVAELWTFAPNGVTPDLVVDVDPEDRLRMLRAHRSQFRPEDLEGFGSRPQEHFVLRWRAASAPVLPALLGED